MDSSVASSLSPAACVIRGFFPGIKEDRSACGVLLHPQKGIVLSHGSVLADLCKNNENLLQKIKTGSLITPRDLSDCKFSALVDSSWKSERILKQNLHRKMVHVQPEGSMFEVGCKIIGVFRNHNFYKTVCTLMPENNWSFTSGTHNELAASSNDDNTSKEAISIESEISIYLLSYFMLLRCDSLVYQGENPSWLLKLYPSSNLPLTGRYKICTVGEVAEILATPFAGLNPSVFFNSYSCGVVSNVAGERGCWIITDARCIPGSEGGPIFTIQSDGSRQLAAIVVASLCWKNREWVGFSLACSIGSIFQAIRSNTTSDELDWQNFEDQKSSQQVKEVKHITTIKKLVPLELATGIDSNTPPSFLSKVVLIKVGSTWGSGFVIGTGLGLILTCSHVIKDVASSNTPVLIQCRGSPNSLKADVIYRQSGQDIHPYDVAILKCPAILHHMTDRNVPRIKQASVGNHVLVMGHALFSPDLCLHPSVSKGVVSKIIRIRDEDIMLQTTCAVHAGISGGPVVDKAGNLVGIIVCNTVDKGSASVFPHVNFSIPASTIWPAILSYINHGDAAVMKSIRVHDSQVRKIWALETNMGLNSGMSKL